MDPLIRVDETMCPDEGPHDTTGWHVGGQYTMGAHDELTTQRRTEWQANAESIVRARIANQVIAPRTARGSTLKCINTASGFDVLQIVEKCQQYPNWRRFTEQRRSFLC